MTSIPIADPELSPAATQQVHKVMNTGQLADGPEVRRFEADFAEYCAASHAIATANGTTALHTALHAVGIGPGDRVITSPFSFIATANAVRHCGAEPIFADINPQTYALDPDAVEATLQANNGEIDAIIPVHLYGLPAEMNRVAELADRFDLAVVEDAAQAHGAEYEGTPVGTIGDVGCFSFYPTKNMTTGEGGAIVTDRDDIATRARQFINHGRSGDTRHGYEHVEVGHNFRMTSLAAAIGRTQLDRLPSYTRIRREYASKLTRALESVPGLTVPIEPPDRRHVYHQYTIRVKDRPTFRDRLEANGIGTGVYYPTPIHLQPAYQPHSRSFPVSEEAASEVLSLPVHPGLTADEIKTVADTVKETAATEVSVADD